MPFREKTAWISLVSMSGIYGLYFWSVTHSARQQGRFETGGLLETIVALVIVQIVLTVIVAIVAPRDANTPRDEREKLIDLRATRVAYYGLATGVATACLFGAFSAPIVFGTNSILFILVTVEVLRSACQIVQYRSGA